MLPGALWFGLYLGIVLLPLGAALLLRLADGATAGSHAAALVAATGMIAFAAMAAEFSLLARIRAATRPFGTDALQYFHRLMGVAALGFLLLHGFGAALLAGSWRMLDPAGAGGAGALAFWLALLLVAAAWWRRRLPLQHEHWQALHLLLAMAVVVSAEWHLQAALMRRGETLLAAILLAYGVAFLLLLVDHRLLRPLRIRRRPWRIVANRNDGGSTRTLTLEPEGHAGLGFAPGQFAWLSTSSPFGFRQHPITISSSAESPGRIEFSIKALGDWSGVEVPRLQPGSHAWVDGPYGAFSTDSHPAEGFLLVGGGIGITPMRSMLLTLRDRDDRRPVILVHAAHDPARAVFRDELQRLAVELGGRLRLVSVYEAGPAPGANGRGGRVTRELLAELLPPGIARWQCFICGPAPMVESVARALRALGLPDDRIHAERFDMV